MTAHAVPTTARDEAEATCRMRMAEVARTQVRGWDGERQRVALLAVVDALLDAYNEAT